MILLESMKYDICVCYICMYMSPPAVLMIVLSDELLRHIVMAKSMVRRGLSGCRGRGGRVRLLPFVLHVS